MAGTLVLRGATKKSVQFFPLFYSYITYAFFAALVMYAIYWFDPVVLYPRAFWFNYLLNALAEFAVLVEISDHIFKPFAMIRNLGRALTLLITAGFGLFYILPTILDSHGRSMALSGFSLRTFVTKAVILFVLFLAARHYGMQLGKNLAGLMLGFSIYVAINIAMLASARAFDPMLYRQIAWVLSPLASVLCVLAWTVSLWEVSPAPSVQAISTATRRGSDALAVELSRFDSELSKILHK